jgi:hypothetical protein
VWEFWLLVIWLVGIPLAMVVASEVLDKEDSGVVEKFEPVRLALIGTAFVLFWPATLVGVLWIAWQATRLPRRK